MSKLLILQNTIFLFLRSILTICIGLFASRVLLQKLGIDDYGVYSIAAGVVAAFSSIRSFFSSSIQRFINYEKGLGNEKEVNKIFCTGVNVQIIISVIIIILFETIGFFAINKLNLTYEQMETANIVFQLSVATSVLSILTVPFDALIIANERMNVYATLSVIESILKLVVVYLISIGPFTLVVNYAIALLIVSFIIRTVNSIYCTKNFPESKYHFIWDMALFKKMIKFAGWNFCGNTGFTLTHEGINYIFNLLCGVSVNAARGIVYQIMNSLNSLIGNIDVAFKPQTNTSAASLNQSLFYNLLSYNGKITVLLYVALMLPIMVFANQLVTLWLGETPNYVVDMMRAASIYYFVRCTHPALNLYFNSIGQLKWYQLTELLFFLMNLPMAYLLLSYGMPVWTVFIGMAIIELVSQFTVLKIGNIKNGLRIDIFLKQIYSPFMIMFVCALLIFYIQEYIIKLSSISNWFLIIVSAILLALIILQIAFVGMFDKKQKETIITIFKSRFK